MLVGIDKYRPATPSEIQAAQPALLRLRMIHPGDPPARRNWDRLYGSVNDITGIYDLLVHRYGFDPADIVTLTDEQATRQAILDNLRSIFIGQAQDGDTLVFYFSGHGSQMRNSLSADKTDKADETIVPWDANAGYWDIRDKELARIFNEALDKHPHVAITALFDSCHSGSIARGFASNVRDRSELPDDRDAKDAYNAPAPETRGALIFSAAQFDEAAEEADDRTASPPIPHGVFTLAFMQALQAASPATPAIDVFRIARSKLHALSSEYTQEPVIAGTDARLHAAIFGNQPNAAAKTLVTVLNHSAGTNQFIVDGGYALGIQPGALLESVAPAVGGAPILATVQSVDGMSQATVTANDPADVPNIYKGDIFAVAKWAFPAGSKLTVWLPPSNLSASEIAAAANDFAQLAGDSHVEWISDPARTNPTHIIDWNGSTWEFRSPSHIANLGSQPNASTVLSALRAESGTPKPRLFLYLPPSRDLLAHLALGAGTENDAINVTQDQNAAQYWLIGTFESGAVHYAWIRPDAIHSISSSSALPAQSETVPVGASAFDAPAQILTKQITAIAKIVAWMNLSMPPDAQPYPYRLELRNALTSKAITESELRSAPADMTSHARQARIDEVKEGDTYDVILAADPNAFSSYIPTRKAYVFAIDSQGEFHRLFPASDADDQTNRLPPDVRPPNMCNSTGSSKTPAAPPEPPYSEICVRSVTIGAPYGIDTYFLLTTDQPIGDLSIFTGEPLNSVEPRGGNPLADLLAQIDGNHKMRGGIDPENWSIERISVLSVPAGPADAKPPDAKLPAN